MHFEPDEVQTERQQMIHPYQVIRFDFGVVLFEELIPRFQTRFSSRGIKETQLMIVPRAHRLEVFLGVGFACAALWVRHDGFGAPSPRGTEALCILIFLFYNTRLVTHKKAVSPHIGFTANNNKYGGLSLAEYYKKISYSAKNKFTYSLNHQVLCSC